jgi:hypothetical protein
VRLTYTSRYEEYLAASRMAARTVFTFWQRYWCILLYVALAVLLVYLIGLLQQLLWPHLPGNVIRAAGLVCFVALFFVCAFLINKASAPLYARWLRTRHPEREVVFQLDDEGLQLESGQTRTKVGYSGIQQIVIDKQLIGFVVGVSVLYLPLRAFASQDGAHALVRHVFAKVDQRARERSLEQRAIREIVS